MSKRPAKRHKIWPMPVEEIINHPLYLNMPSAAFGAFMRLCLHYWVTNCSPPPESSAELQVISRAVAPIWIKHRETIMQAFRDVQPALDAYRRKRLSGENSINFAARKGGAANRSRLMQ